MKTIREDFRWLLIISLLVVVITTIPYLVAYSQDPTDWVFTGFVFGVEDGNSYIAKMLNGANGAWLFKSPYSAVPQKGFFAFFPYLIMGKFTSSPGQHAQLVGIYQIFRWIAIISLIFSTYLFVSLFIHKLFYRRAATIIATIGGGVGWFSIFGLHEIFGINLPLEFYSPETFGFLSVLGLPHLVFARSLLLFGFVFYLEKTPDIRFSIAAGGSWFLIGFFQPISLVTGCAVLFFHSLFILVKEIINKEKQEKFELKKHIIKSRKTFVMFLFASPWVIYNFLSFRLDPYLRGWEGQNIISSPPPIDYLFSLWLILPFVIIGFIKAIKKYQITPLSLPAVWILLFPFLAYAPHNLQRRLPEGVWVSIVLFALYALQEMKLKRSKLITSGLVVISLFTSIILLAGSLQVSMNPGLPVFRPKKEIQAFTFLANNTNPGDVIVASYETSNALPAWASMMVLAGHGPETIKLKDFLGIIQSYYSGSMSKIDEEEILREYSVDYVFWGPLEQQIGGADLFQKENLTIIYQEDPYYIFKANASEVKQ